MGGRRHMQVYNPDEEQKLQGIALPEKIKCGRCLKNVHQSRFSTKQLTDARRQIKDSGKVIKAINCRKCTGEIVVEIECIMCYKTKGIEEFSKVQRQKADTAKCYKCMEEQVREKPVNESRYEPGGNPFNTPDHSGGIYPDYWSAASTTNDSSSTWGDNCDSSSGGRIDEKHDMSDHLQQMSLSGSGSETLGASENGVKNKNDDNWSEVRTKSWHTGSVSANSASSTNKNGKQQAPSGTESGRSFASSAVERSVTSDVRPGGWIKKSDIPLGSMGGLILPQGDGERERGPLVDAWDPEEDDDDEEEEDDDDDSDDDTVI